MYLQGPNIVKGADAANRTPSADSIVALVVGIPTALVAAAPLTVGTSLRCIQTKDAEEVGITAAYDTDSSVLAHAHISEIFRLAPSAIVHVTFVDNSDLANFDANVLATLVTSMKMAFGDAINDIKAIGVAHNDTAFDITGVIAQVPYCQSVVAELAKEFIFIDSVMLETVPADSFTVSGLASLRTLDAENISLVLGQDTGVAIAKSSAIGAALGMFAVRNVNESLGSVNIANKPDGKKGDRDYPLTDNGLSKFQGVKINDKDVEILSTAEKKDLGDKGYIFIGKYPGYSGLFFNGDSTAVETASKYRFIHANRVWNKCARALRNALIPTMESTLKLDATTGGLKASTAKYLESIGSKAVTDALGDAISGFETTIDPAQTPTPEVPLQVSGKIVKDGILHEMNFELAITNAIT
jgi:hypothetical protein